MYYVTFNEMNGFWERMLNGGRKSFRYEELKKDIPVKRKGEFLCHYLEGLSADLKLR